MVRDIDELIDEAPQEYIDPISGDIMKDPVMLPETRQIVDRITIERSLLDKPIDPFNRQPLRKEDLIPRIDVYSFFSYEIEPELKEEIHKWLKDHNADL